jgi:transposase
MPATAGRPAPDPAKIARAAELAAQGASREAIAAELGVSERTVSRWAGRAPGRPRLADGQGSRTTAWRQRKAAPED